jgi:NAD-dependent DNA ligase
MNNNANLEREKTLRAASYAYYHGDPHMSDAEFDTLWREHKAAREDDPTTFPATTILDDVGYAAPASSGFGKVKHATPMQSLDNAMAAADGTNAQLESWLKFVKSATGCDDLTCVIEPKIDGLSLNVTYVDGVLQSAVTRGDGATGDDVTANALACRLIPSKLEHPDAGNAPVGRLEIRGEVFMDFEAFAALNARQEAAGQPLYANPRNAAAGSLRLHDSAVAATRGLKFLAHGAELAEDASFGGRVPSTYAQLMWELLPYVEFPRRYFVQLASASDAWDMTKMKQQILDMTSYPVDGAVVKVQDLQHRKLLGSTSRAPRWAIAVKFEQEQVTTILEGIDVQVGRSGVLTPVARLKPVLLDGSTVSQATLNNEDWINRRYLKIGDTVVVQKAGAIIPEIVSSVEGERALQAVLHTFGAGAGVEPGAFTEEQVRTAFAETGRFFRLVDHLGGKCPCCGSTDLQQKVETRKLTAADVQECREVTESVAGCLRLLPKSASEQECAEAPSDIYVKMAAEFFGVHESEVTAAQRHAIKLASHGARYGLIPGSNLEHSIEAAILAATPDVQAENTKTQVKWYCMNSNCPAQLAARIQHFCSRKCLDIEGIGEEMAAALAEAMGMMGISSPLDLLRWTVDDLMVMTWVTDSGGQMTFGESRAKKAYAALQRANTLPLHRWLFALGIPTIGENTSKEISRLFSSGMDLMVLCAQDAVDRCHVAADALIRITEGEDKNSTKLKPLAISSHLGPVSCKALLDFARTEYGQEALRHLAGWGVRSENYDPIPTPSDDKTLFGKSFVITGTLSVGRDVLKAEIEAAGGKVSGSVTTKTDFLVAGEGGGKKSAEAAKKGVPTIDEAALRAML